MGLANPSRVWVLTRGGVMTVVAAADAEVEDADTPVVAMERLEAFGTAVLRDAMNRPSKMLNGGLYLRGLLEQGTRTSWWPMAQRMGGEADYDRMQQFLAASPWYPGLVM